MTTPFHGVVSIGLVLVTVIVAVATGFQSSSVLDLVYLLGCALAPQFTSPRETTDREEA